MAFFGATGPAVAIGKSDSANTKEVEVTTDDTCELKCPTTMAIGLWNQADTWPDVFEISVPQNNRRRAKVKAQRMDAPGGWGMDLKFFCDCSSETGDKAMHGVPSGNDPARHRLSIACPPNNEKKTSAEHPFCDQIRAGKWLWNGVYQFRAQVKPKSYALANLGKPFCRFQSHTASGDWSNAYLSEHAKPPFFGTVSKNWYQDYGSGVCDIGSPNLSFDQSARRCSSLCYSVPNCKYFSVSSTQPCNACFLYQTCTTPVGNPLHNDQYLLYEMGLGDAPPPVFFSDADEWVSMEKRVELGYRVWSDRDYVYEKLDSSLARSNYADHFSGAVHSWSPQELRGAGREFKVKCEGACRVYAVVETKKSAGPRDGGWAGSDYPGEATSGGWTKVEG